MKNYLENVDREALRARAEQMLHYRRRGAAAPRAAGPIMPWTRRAASRFWISLMFETCLLSLGLWLGTCFSKCFKKLRTLFFVAFAASWLYMLWRIFFDEEE